MPKKNPAEDEGPEREEEPDQTSGAQSEEPTEISLVDVVNSAYMEMEQSKKALEKEAAEFTKKIDELRKYIYTPLDTSTPDEKPLEFREIEKFRTLLDRLCTGIGQSLEYVRLIEKSRKYPPAPEAMLSSVPETSEETPKTEPAPPPVNVSVASGKTGGVGLGGWLAAREQRKMLEQWLAAQEIVTQPSVSEEKIHDIVEYGKQLLPAINLVKGWIPGALSRIKHQPGPHLYWVLHEQLAKHLSQYFGTLEAFCGAYVQFQKGIIDGRKIALVKALARIAEAQSMGGGPGMIQRGGVLMAKGAKLGPQGFSERK